MRNNLVLRVLVIVIMVQVLGKYMIIRYLDPWGNIPGHQTFHLFHFMMSKNQYWMEVFVNRRGVGGGL